MCNFLKKTKDNNLTTLLFLEKVTGYSCNHIPFSN